MSEETRSKLVKNCADIYCQVCIEKGTFKEMCSLYDKLIPSLLAMVESKEDNPTDMTHLEMALKVGGQMVPDDASSLSSDELQKLKEKARLLVAVAIHHCYAKDGEVEKAEQMVFNYAFKNMKNSEKIKLIKNMAERAKAKAEES